MKKIIIATIITFALASCSKSKRITYAKIESKTQCHVMVKKNDWKEFWNKN